MFRWLSKNKKKIVFLWVIKVIFFIPHSVEAQTPPAPNFEIPYSLATSTPHTVYCDAPHNSVTMGGVRIGSGGVSSSDLLESNSNSANFCNGSIDDTNFLAATSSTNYYITLYTTNGAEFSEIYGYLIVFWNGTNLVIQSDNTDNDYYINFFNDIVDEVDVMVSPDAPVSGGDSYAEGTGIAIGAVQNVSTFAISACNAGGGHIPFRAYIIGGGSTYTTLATSSIVYLDEMVDCTQHASSTLSIDDLTTIFNFSQPQDIPENGGIVIQADNGYGLQIPIHIFGTTTVSTFGYNGQHCYIDTINDRHCTISNFGGGRPGLIYFAINGGSENIPLDCNTNPTSRILNFLPNDGVLVDNPVEFGINACINEEDLGIISGINITLHNIDQNVLLLSEFSPSDIYLLREESIETPGLFSYSTTTTLGYGNYRIEACIKRSYFFGFIINPLSSINDCQSHQFIVGEPTFIGNISQTIYGETNDFLNGLTATSSAALAATCNPIGGNFGIRECISFLLIPSAGDLQNTMQTARTGILSRAPWGYVNRVYTIFSNTATSTLPSFTASIQVGAGNTETPEITTITIDPGDMIAGGGALLDSIRDPITDKSPRDVFEPMVQLTIALGVLFTIITDLVSSHRHANEEQSRTGKLS